MSEDGKASNQQMFKCWEMRVMIASSGFGLGVDVADIEYVMLYGCPAEGLMYSRLSGRGGRNHDLQCVCQLLYSGGEVREADEHMQVACSEEVCLRDLLVKSVLESKENLECEPNNCCSVCASGVVPGVYFTPFHARRRGTARRHNPCVVRRITAQQKTTFSKELMALQLSVAENRLWMRGLDAVIPVKLIDKLVKNSSRILTIEDITSLSVSCELAPNILEVLNRISPLGTSVARNQPLADIGNVTSVLVINTTIEHYLFALLGIAGLRFLTKFHLEFS